MDIFESLENLNISEECFNDILALVEEYVNEIWSGTSKSKWNYEDPERQESHGYTSKRVEMSPTDYIKKCARQFKRRGAPLKTKSLEKDIEDSRKDHMYDKDTTMINHYAQQIKDKKAQVDEPFLFYHHSGDIASDQQDGLHRALAAKKLGIEKMPVHIFHPNQKKTKKEQREYAQYKQRRKKKIGEVRADNKKAIDRGSRFINRVL